MQKKLANLIAMIVSVGILFTTTHASENRKANTPLTFQLESIGNKKITIVETLHGFSFSTLKGKNVIAMFYIHRKPCKDALKVLSDAQKRYKNLEIVGFDLVDSKNSVLKKFAREQKAQNVIFINKEHSKKFANYISERVAWPGSVPFIIFVNDKGVVKHMQLGGIPADKFDELYKKMKSI